MMLSIEKPKSGRCCIFTIQLNFHVSFSISKQSQPSDLVGTLGVSAIDCTIWETWSRVSHLKLLFCDLLFDSIFRLLSYLVAYNVVVTIVGGNEPSHIGFKASIAFIKFPKKMRVE